MSTPLDVDAGTALILRALTPYARMPDETDIARLTDDLISYAEQLLPSLADRAQAAAALEDWARLAEEGPEDGPLANWNHARALARTVRRFHEALGVTRNSRGPAYIGRPGLPPQHATDLPQ